MQKENAEIATKNALAALKEEAEFNANRSKQIVEQGRGTLDDPHSDAATHQRMAGVYEQTAKAVEQTLQIHRRNLLRSMNPYQANLSDKEADKILANCDYID